MSSLPPEEPGSAPLEPTPPGDGWGPPAPDSAPPPTTVRNGLGVAAMVLGIISLVLIILFPPLGVLLGILGVVFGIIGIRRVRRGEATNRGQALAGAITGGVGLLVSAVLLAVVGSFIFSHRQQIDQYTRCLQNAHTTQARNACQQQFRSSVNR